MLPLALGFWVFGFGILGLLALCLWIAGLVDLLRHREELDRRQRAAWILVIVLLPVIGTLVYFAKRPNSEREREQMVAAEAHRHQHR